MADPNRNSITSSSTLWSKVLLNIGSSAMKISYSPAVRPTSVMRGSLTFEAEGSPDPWSRYFSRRLHVPTAASGVTIGRGFDLKLRTVDDAARDFLAAGIDSQRANTLSMGAGLIGDAARDFASLNSTLLISEDEEIALFERTYAEAEADVVRISNKAGVVELYGKLDWDATDPKIKDVLIDLRYRGDYTPRTREWVQSAAVLNNIELFTEKMADREFWAAVPLDRFERRIEFLEGV